MHGGVGAQKVDGRSQTKPFACKVFIVSGLGGIECMSDRVSGDGWGGLGPGRGTRRRGGFLWRAGDEIFGFQGSCGDVSGGDIFAGMGGLRGCARFTNALVRTRCKDSIVAGDIRPAGGPMSVYSHGPGGMRDVLPKTGGHCFVDVRCLLSARCQGHSASSAYSSSTLSDRWARCFWAATSRRLS